MALSVTIRWLLTFRTRRTPSSRTHLVSHVLLLSVGRLRYDLRDDAQVSDYLMSETRAVSMQLAKISGGNGFLTTFVRSADMVKVGGWGRR